MFRYYLTVIFGCTGGIAAILGVLGDVPVWKAILIAFSTTAAAFGVDAVCALLVRLIIPNRKMNPFHPFWKVWHWERKFYVKLGIRRWKDKIPETGGLLVGFSKKKIANRKDNAYLLQFLKETCYAELMHTISIPMGFLVLLLTFAWNSLPAGRFLLAVGLPVAVINALLQLLPILVQRYVRPFLISNYRRNERKNAVHSPSKIDT